MDLTWEALEAQGHTRACGRVSDDFLAVRKATLYKLFGGLPESDKQAWEELTAQAKEDEENDLAAPSAVQECVLCVPNVGSS